MSEGVSTPFTPKGALTVDFAALLLLGRERLPSWIESHQLAALGPHGADVMDGQPEVQAGAPAQSIRMPGVLTSGGHDARGAGSGSHPNDCPQVAEVSRVLQQHDVTGTSQDRVGIGLNRTPSHGDDLAARHHILERLNVHNLERDTHVRGKPL